MSTIEVPSDYAPLPVPWRWSGLRAIANDETGETYAVKPRPDLSWCNCADGDGDGDGDGDWDGDCEDSSHMELGDLITELEAAQAAGGQS